jgi:endonuclease YncB( thermonuclease family)
MSVMSRLDGVPWSVLVLMVFFIVTAKAYSAEITSYAIVKEDGTLRLRGRTIRLYGIYIPATDRTCQTFTRPVNCGTRAVLALEFKIGANFVSCEPQWRNDDRSITAVCHVEGEDLGAYLIERGWALALPDAPFEYVALEKIARSRGIGVWGFPGKRAITKP